MQRKRTMMVFYALALPICFISKYVERKFYFDRMDSHLNKSNLFGGRKLYPDTWTGKEWWSVIMCEVTNTYSCKIKCWIYHVISCFISIFSYFQRSWLSTCYICFACKYRNDGKIHSYLDMIKYGNNTFCKIKQTTAKTNTTIKPSSERHVWGQRVWPVTRNWYLVLSHNLKDCFIFIPWKACLWFPQKLHGQRGWLVSKNRYFNSQEPMAQASFCRASLCLT